MKKWLTASLSFLLMTTILLAACGGNEAGNNNGDSAGASSEEIAVNVMTEPPELDPGLSDDNKSGWILDHLFEGLYMKDEDGQPELGVAEDVEKSDDETIYTFTLREDAKWSDGSAVTAEDFEYAWERVLNPDVGSKMAFYLYYIKGAEDYNKGNGSVDDVGIQAEDDKTLIVELEEPLDYFDEMLTYWTYYPVQKELVEENDNWAAEADSFVSNGPFTLTEWKHDSNITVEKNKEYFDQDVVNLNKIDFTMVDDATTYQQMFTAGELDMIMEIPSDMIASVQEEDTYKEEPYFGTYMYMFNVEEEPFTNEKIRKAFAMALDRDSLTENVTKAGEQPAFAMVPPGVETPDGDFRDEVESHFQEDAAEAKQLLQEGMEEEGWDTLPDVELLYNTDENHKTVAEAVQEMLNKNLDISVKLVNQEWKTFLDSTAQGNYQMARLGWTGVVLDPVVMLDAYLGDSPDNETGWVNEEFDDLIKQAKIETDQEERFEMLHEAEEILMEEMPFIPVYYYAKTYMTADNLDNVAYYRSIYPNLKWASVEK